MKNIQEMLLRRQRDKKRSGVATASLATQACKQFLSYPHCAYGRVRHQCLYLGVDLREDMMGLYLRKQDMLEAIRIKFEDLGTEDIVRDIRFTTKSAEQPISSSTRSPRQKRQDPTQPKK